jgi:hypothetical protein
LGLIVVGAAHGFFAEVLLDAGQVESAGGQAQDVESLVLFIVEAAQGDVGGFDVFAAAEQGRPFDDVAQLAHVAFPGIILKLGVGGFADPDHVLFELLGEVRNKMLGEQADIVSAFAQRRQVDRDHVEAIVEILAKLAFANRLFNVAVRRGDYTDVYRNVVDPAHPAKRPLFQEAQELGLKRGRHVAHLIEKHRPTVRQFEQTFLLLPRIGERAALVPEEFALQQGLRQGGAGDVHETAMGPVGIVVNDTGSQILAGSTVTAQEHGGRAALGDILKQVEHANHRLVAPDHLVETELALEITAQLAHLPAQLGGFQALLDGEHQLIHVERLGDVVVRPQADRLDRLLQPAEGGDHDDDRLAVVLANLAEHVQAGEVGQLVVEQDQVVIAMGVEIETGGGVTGFVHGIALFLELLPERPANKRLILDD